jgi:hypothetical protein
MLTGIVKSYLDSQSSPSGSRQEIQPEHKIAVNPRKDVNLCMAEKFKRKFSRQINVILLSLLGGFRFQVNLF